MVVDRPGYLFKPRNYSQDSDLTSHGSEDGWNFYVAEGDAAGENQWKENVAWCKC